MFITWPDVLSLVFAALFGSIIGAERQISGKPAGLRTNMLICLGAALFTIASLELGKGESITRIAAQIVTGVGFLGAGAVIQDRGGVHGLTTAASIWLVAAIGLACGARYYLLAFITTILAAVVLIAFAPLANYLTRLGQKKGIKQHLDEHPTY